MPLIQKMVMEMIYMLDMKGWKTTRSFDFTFWDWSPFGRSNSSFTLASFWKRFFFWLILTERNACISWTRYIDTNHATSISELPTRYLAPGSIKMLWRQLVQDEDPPSVRLLAMILVHCHHQCVKLEINVSVSFCDLCGLRKLFDLAKLCPLRQRLQAQMEERFALSSGNTSRLLRRLSRVQGNVQNCSCL